MKKMVNDLQYTVLLAPDSRGGFFVQVPALGISTQGDDEQHALYMAKDAIHGWIDSLIEDGEPVPVEKQPPLVQSVTVSFDANISSVVSV